MHLYFLKPFDSKRHYNILIFLKCFIMHFLRMTVFYTTRVKLYIPYSNFSSCPKDVLYNNNFPLIQDPLGCIIGNVNEYEILKI